MPASTPTESIEERFGRLAALVNSAALSQAMSVAAELRLADHLADGPKDALQLAQAVQCDAGALRRLMRALASIELCEERADGTFALTATGALLSSEAGSMRDWALWWGRYLWAEWALLLHSVRSGESARSRLRAGTWTEQLERDGAAAALFDGAMSGLSRLLSRSIARSYDFSAARRIVDVGGGSGELLAQILQRHPRARGVVYDLPRVVERARRQLALAGVAERCEPVGGNFFDSVPEDGDVYLLKRVIHDWGDSRSLVILRNCRAAMAPGGTLLLVEQLAPLRISACAAHQDVARRDLTMLLATGGRERTQAEVETLLRGAGFALYAVAPAALNFYVIEARPAA